MLGAEVCANGYPSPALVNRLDTSIQLVVAPDFPGPALWTYRLRERAAVLLAWWEVNGPGR
jgi:hypothetical protein